jgi:hypothetical protein
MICCWILQALASRHTFDADGVSYQNIADVCLRGNWHSLVNGYWSPGYPFLLTMWFKLFHPGAYFVPLTVRWFGVLSLIFTLTSFEFFLSSFLNFRKYLYDSNSDSQNYLSDRSIRVIGYAIFFWISVFMTPASLDHPDICLFALYLSASGLSLRIVADPHQKWRRFASLGVILGLAYLVKAVMFPLSFIFFVALLFHHTCRQHPARLGIGIAAFLLVSVPFITVLSQSKGRLTYGDSGSVNYHSVITGDTKFPGAELNPRQVALYRLSAAPHIADYTDVLRLGTYPAWADPSFRYVPAPFHLMPRRQLNRLHVVMRYYFDLYFVGLAGLVCGLLALVLYAGEIQAFCRLFASQIVLWLPALAGFALYALVRAEARFLPGFTIAIFAAVLASIHLKRHPETTRVSECVVTAIVILLVLQAAVTVAHDASKVKNGGEYPDWRIAERLHEVGVNPGDRVSFLGDTLTNHAWAYLAHVSIAAEIPTEDETTFWKSTEAEKRDVFAWLASKGIKVLLTRRTPALFRDGVWELVPGTDYYLVSLSASNANR